MTKPDHATPNERLSDQQLDQVSGGIGSQSSGAGAGKVTFNPFSITRKVDKASPVLL
jgi:type VI protein secretion system component Hcp